MSNAKTELTLELSLQAYFYSELKKLNDKKGVPLPNEAIYYSSRVLDRFGMSKELFEFENGKVREKVLGIKLLESTHLSKEQKKRQLRDVGDTALFICGYFSSSLNKKIIDSSYYADLGISAYQTLDQLIPEVLDIPSFYEKFSRSFDSIVELMSLVSKQTMENYDLTDCYYIVDRKAS